MVRGSAPFALARNLATSDEGQGKDDRRAGAPSPSAASQTVQPPPRELGRSSVFSNFVRHASARRLRGPGWDVGNLLCAVRQLRLFERHTSHSLNGGEVLGLRPQEDATCLESERGPLASGLSWLCPPSRAGGESFHALASHEGPPPGEDTRSGDLSHLSTSVVQTHDTQDTCRRTSCDILKRI